MSEDLKLNRPWMVAVWPGMGSVAMAAGYYLMAKLGMHLFAEVANHELFDVEHVEVEGGVIRRGQLPRSRWFLWKDPRERRDIIVFIGEAQPSAGKYAFCHRLVEDARALGVERVFTFAAMATQMRPEDTCRVFGAVTDKDSLPELRDEGVEILEEGHIAGLNGVLLGAAAEAELRGACLLGEMPQIFSQLPFPRASLAVLKIFTKLADIELDTSELSEQAQAMDQKLGEILSRVEQAMTQAEDADEESPEFEIPAPGALDAADEQLIERLFEQAAKNRSKAYELKRELDRLGAFEDYEDRFLDLFKHPE